MSLERARESKVPWWTLLAIAFVGAWLRFEQLSTQIIADDEWHALNFLLEHPVSAVPWRFGLSDHSIPLTLFDGLLGHTIGLSELGMRSVPFASGVAALVVLPALVHRHVGAKRCVIFAALLAISPLHVYFSRYARPYSTVFVLALAALFLLELFAQRRRPALAWGAAICTGLAPWFQPVALPFVLAGPVLFLALDTRLGPSLGARARLLWPQALAVVLILALLLGPPVLVDFDTLRERSGRGQVGALDIGAAWRLLAGSGKDWLAPLIAAMSLVGALALARSRPLLLRLMAVSLLASIAALVATSPTGVEIPIVAVRYVIPALGIVLLLAACGLAELDAWLASIAPPRWPRHLPSSAACAALLAFGPLLCLHDRPAAIFRTPNDWMHHGYFQYQYDPTERARWMDETIRPPRLSRFYQKLAREVKSSPSARLHLVEAPWSLQWDGSPFVVYQAIHGARTSIGFVHRRGEARPWGELPWDDSRFEFANFVHIADVDELRRRGVTHVVLHKDLAHELPSDPARIGADIGPLVIELQAKLGPPCHEDEILVAFDLRPTS